MSRDLMHTAGVKDLARDATATPPPTAAVAHNLYSDEELVLVPQSAIDRALGVANHLPHATIRFARCALAAHGCALYPLFSDEVTALIRKLIPSTAGWRWPLW